MCVYTAKPRDKAVLNRYEQAAIGRAYGGAIDFDPRNAEFEGFSVVDRMGHDDLDGRDGEIGEAQERDVDHMTAP